MYMYDLKIGHTCTLILAAKFIDQRDFTSILIGKNIELHSCKDSQRLLHCTFSVIQVHVHIHVHLFQQPTY